VVSILAECGPGPRADALPIVEPLLDAEGEAERERVREHAHAELVESGIGNVLPAVMAGRAETLLVEPRRAIWGRVEPVDGDVRTEDDRRPTSEDLVDRAIAEGLAHGTTVLPARAEDLPGGATVIARLRH